MICFYILTSLPFDISRHLRMYTCIFIARTVREYENRFCPVNHHLAKAKDRSQIPKELPVFLTMRSGNMNTVKVTSFEGKIRRPDRSR